MMGAQGKRRKSAKNNTRTDKFFYFKLIFVLLLAEAYYAYNYAMIREYNDETKVSAEQFNLTASLEP
jgi:uncharacterized membrane protein